MGISSVCGIGVGDGVDGETVVYLSGLAAARGDEDSL